jgi:hypothetical protein
LVSVQQTAISHQLDIQEELMQPAKLISIIENPLDFQE